MSAAVMSSSVYDFGDTLLKSHSSHSSSSAARHQHGGVRWADARVAGSLLDYQQAQQQAQQVHQAREGLSRRASNPVTSAPPPGLAALNMSMSHAHALALQLDTQPPSPPAVAVAAPATPTTPALPVAHRKLDRSHSEPANAASVCKSAAAAAAAAAANINTSRYKTELCRPYEESGSCKYGDKCQFAHGAHELRTLVRHPKYKTELCRTYHTIGLCPYGPRCHFVHNDEEVIGHAKPSMQNAMPAAMARPKALTLATAPLPAHAAHAAHSPAHSYLGGSTADSPSPTSSLSQSPTNSHRSFFMSSEDVFGSGSVSPTPSSATANTAFSFGQDFGQDFGLVQSPSVGSPTVGHHGPCGSTGSGSSRDSPSPPGSPFRLPIFNTLSNQVLKIRLDA